MSSANHLLEELEPVVAENLDRHLGMAQEWHPHDYVPWSQGRDFALLGGEDWAPEQSRLSETAKAAMFTNLLTEDNLPSYHREIATRFGRDGAWGTWVGRWTAEENRHGIAMRDYLVVTRGVDPVELERARMDYMTSGYDSGDKTPLEAVTYVSFQELATRVSHRNTGKVTNDPIADRMLARISKDENLHMVFYRNIVAAALEIAPDETMRAIAEEVIGFEMPGATMAGFRRSSMIIAKAGIYDLRLHHDDVIMPILRHWEIFDRTDFGAVGEQARDELAAFLEGLDAQAPGSSSAARRTAPAPPPSPTATRRPTSRPEPPSPRRDGLRSAARRGRTIVRGSSDQWSASMGRTRTWLIRGAVVTALAVLVAAWAVGIVGLGDSPSPAAERVRSTTPESSTTPDDQRWAGRQETPRRTRKADPSKDAVVEPIADTADDPTTDAPTTPAPTSPNTPDPSDEPSDSPSPSDPPSSPPSNPPSTPPSPPDEECTDPSDVLDCVLDPITGGP